MTSTLPEAVREVVERDLIITEIAGTGPYRLLGFSSAYLSDESIARLERDLLALGWRSSLHFSGGKFQLDLIPVERAAPAVRQKLPWVNIILLAATLISTTFVGAIMEDADLAASPLNIVYGLPYSLMLLAILGLHELGHYFMSRYHGVKASLPYFIPAPNIFGTFGAVIMTKSPLYNRRVLFDIGVAGPLAGFVVAVAALVYGLSTATVVETAGFEAGSIQLGDSVLLYLLSLIIVGPLPEGYDIFLGPIAYAGWIGLLITAINLLPIGQLDGGHITYAMFGRRQGIVARLAFVFLVSLVFFWPAWFFMILIIYLIKLDHPVPSDDALPLNPARKAIGWLALLILVLCFIPVPISGLDFGL